MNFNNIFDPYISQARPHIQRAANRAEQYTCTVIDLLTHIRDAVEIEDSPRQFRYCQFNAANVLENVAMVPMGETWCLEVVAWDSNTGANILTYADDGIRYRIGSGTTMPPSAPARFVGPCQITAKNSIAAPACFQFAVYREHRPRRTHAAGQVTVGVSPVQGPQAHDPLHMGLMPSPLRTIA